MTMKRTVILASLCLSVTIGVVIPVCAQNDQGINIKTVDLFFFPPSTTQVEVKFDQDLDSKHPEDLRADNVTIKTLPSNRTVKPTVITREFGSFRQLLITYDAAATPPDLKDTDVNICFATIHYSAPDTSNPPKPIAKVTDSPVCFTGKDKIITPVNIGAQLQAAK